MATTVRGDDSSSFQSPATAVDFQVALVIGEGAFGRVWYGRHKATQRRVALKVVDKCSCQKNPAVRQSILREQGILKDLREHDESNPPRVVQLLASFHDAECLYMALDCHMGGTLQDMIQFSLNDGTSELYFQSLPWYGRELLDGLVFLHNRGVVHGDIKPSNVLVCSHSGRLTWTDFGSARQFEDDGTSDHTPTTISWNPQSMGGTTAFTAPEILGVSTYEFQATQQTAMAADLWSFGCTLYAFWYRDSPFADESDCLVTAKVKTFCQTGRLSPPPILVQGERINESLAQSQIDLLDLLQNNLLRIDPLQRGVGSSREHASSLGKTVEKDERYANLKSHSFFSPNDKRSGPAYLPPKPLWVDQVEKDETEHTLTWRDGSLGWSAFLL